MKYIADFVEEIAEELDSAKRYAETYLERKSYGDSAWASKYREMAHEELEHAGVIHERAAAEIERLANVYTAPAEMEQAWRDCHKKYVEQAAWIKQMLAM